MSTDKEKFASQAAPEVLGAMRDIAVREGRQFQSVLDEAMRDFIEKKHQGRPRASMIAALEASMSDYDALYRKLAR